MSENSGTHAYTRLDFLNCTCTGGLAALAINSIAVKVEGLEKGNESVSSKMAEHGMDREAKLNEIILLIEREKEALCSKITELENEKEEAASKIALLEKELRTTVEKFEMYKFAQLGKEKELRTRFQDFKRYPKTECEKEKEAALSTIAMLEKDLETNEVRTFKQCIRALKQIQDGDKEPKEKLKDYWGGLAKQLKAKKSETAELVEAQKEMIKVLSDLCNGDMDIGVKKFGIIDSYPFRTACKQKFSRQVAEEKAMELCSIWQKAVEDPKWHPFRTTTSNGEIQAEVIDKEDKKLQQLRKEWGDEVYFSCCYCLDKNQRV